jgi:mono/diheme cytochrome c family protein
MPIFAGVCLLLLILPLASAFAAEFSDAQERGEAVLQRWCQDCHVPAGQTYHPDMAPSFESIVRRPGRDATYLRRFLDEDHFPMTTYRLFAAEKDDLVAYLDTLR